MRDPFYGPLRPVTAQTDHDEDDEQDDDNLELSRNSISRPYRPAPARRYRDSIEMSQMVARVARAMVKRAASGDLEALVALRLMREHVDEATKLAAQELHSPTEWTGGYSWTTIGDVLRISRQAARQQFGKQATPGTAES